MNFRRVLPLGPHVGKDLPPGNLPMSRVMDLGRKPGAAWPSTKRPMDGGDMHSAGSGDGLGGIVGRKMNSHTLQVRTSCDSVKLKLRSSSEIANIATPAHHLKMARERIARPNDPWPQRFAVLDLIDDAVASGTSLADLARAFGLDTPYSLETGWRYNYDRKPHMNTVEKMAWYFNVPISTIYSPTPIPQNPKDELTLAREALTGAMGAESVSRVSDEQILAAYRVAMATAKAMLAQ